jgi:hypothetical protein
MEIKPTVGPIGSNPTPAEIFNIGTTCASTIASETLLMYDLEQDMLSKAEVVTSREADTYERVCQMTDEATGKPKYGNDGARKAAAWKLQGEDTLLVAARAERRKIAREIEVKKLHMSYHRDCLNLCRAMLNGGGAVYNEEATRV